jgi:hypothetical protein
MEGTKMKKAKTKKVSRGPVEFKLDYPIEFGEEFIESLELRRPTAGDIESISGSPTLKDLMMIASRCAGQPYPVIKRMDATDAMRLTGVIGDFLGNGQETDESASDS